MRKILDHLFDPQADTTQSGQAP
ncbi:penicillin-binding protein 2, partial [Salmonella enterica subsp. enterica serovar Agona]|nr:penicillin-binding protein 2 [Salmonella enterica subsp. enterica serovar Agona]ECY4802156.1 penicillin-binding protein 2 [Salmonella enterica subsp. enterica serovar Enteritidis]